MRGTTGATSILPPTWSTTNRGPPPQSFPMRIPLVPLLLSLLSSFSCSAKDTVTENNTAPTTNNTTTSTTSNPHATPTGECWVQITGSAAFSPRAGHSSVSFLGQLWVIGGFENREGVPTALNDVWSSPDGATWTNQVARAPFPPRAAHCSLVFRGRLWVLGGNNDTDYYNDVWSSSDGITWELERGSADPGWSDRKGFTCAVVDDRIFLFGGVDYGGLNEIWSSPDGKSWTLEETAPWPPRAHHAMAWVGERLFLFGGSVYTTSTFDDIWMAPGGTGWTRHQRALPHPLFGSTALTTGSTLLLTGGNGNPTGTHRFDGETLTTFPSTFPARSYHTALFHEQRGWVIGGSHTVDLGLALRNDVWATCAPE